MKKTLLFIFFIIFSVSSAQTVEWKTDLNEAVTLSSKLRKPLLILFTANSLANDIQREVFETQDFGKWSQKNVICVKIDLSDSTISPEDMENYRKVKSAFGINDLPRVCFTNASVKNNKTNFQYMGNLGYSSGSGAKSWISKSEDLIHQE